MNGTVIKDIKEFDPKLQVTISLLDKKKPPPVAPIIIYILPIKKSR